MSTNESFTSSELLEILESIGVDTRFESATESEIQVANIECEIGPLLFWVTLFIDEPFFEGFQLFSVRGDVENPFVFAMNFNNVPRIARVAVEIDDEELIFVDDEGETTTKALADVRFAGGVTKEHIRFLLEMWIEDLIDFHELVLDDDDDDNQQVPELRELATASLLDQIVACLSGAQSMTSREIAKLLDNDRHVINSILYKERDRFVHDAAQPPRWSLKE
jgi:hypothetical protein